MTEFEALKLFLVDHTGLAKDALHIYVALAVYLGSCLIFRWKTRQWQPWCLVLLAALMGEAWDLLGALERGGPLQWDATRKDLWNTMLVPTLLLVLSRTTTIFGARTGRVGPRRKSRN